MNERKVLAACDLLLDELKGEIAAVNKAGGAAQAAGHLAEAEQALARAKALGAIRQELEGIRERLKGLVGKSDDLPTPTGTKTPNDAYRVPILQELVAKGGSGKTGEILDAVHERMKHLLTDWDHGTLSSGHSIRWRASVQWCRNTMREEGLIASGSPGGVWEITEAGRRWLEEQEHPFTVPGAPVEIAIEPPVREGGGTTRLLPRLPEQMDQASIARLSVRLLTELRLAGGVLPEVSAVDNTIEILENDPTADGPGGWPSLVTRQERRIQCGLCRTWLLEEKLIAVNGTGSWVISKKGRQWLREQESRS